MLRRDKHAIDETTAAIERFVAQGRDKELEASSQKIKECEASISALESE